MANVNITTADNAAVKAKISEVVTAYKGASKGFAEMFIALCERFTGKDSQSGDMLQHLLDSLGDEQKALRSRVANRLRDFSNNTLLVSFDDGKQKWAVVTKKDGKDKSIFDKAYFEKQVAAAKSSANALTYSPEAAPVEPKPKRFNAGKAEQKAKESLLTLATGLLTVDKGLTPEKLAIKLEAMLKEVMLDVKPVIEAESPNA